MKFFFHLHGNDTGKLTISKTENKMTFFNRYGDHGPMWQRGQLYINVTGNYKVSQTIFLRFSIFFFCRLFKKENEIKVMFTVSARFYESDNCL